MKDFYARLGVARNSSASEIAKAFRRLAAKFHPDWNPGDKEAERKFKEISEAYNCLSNSTERAKYDRGETQPTVRAYQGPVPPVFRTRRKPPPGPTFETGKMEPGKYYSVRSDPVQLGKPVRVQGGKPDPVTGEVPVRVRPGDKPIPGFKVFKRKS